jgi:hypothetical protein
MFRVISALRHDAPGRVGQEGRCFLLASGYVPDLRGQDQQDPVLGLAAGRRAGISQRGAGGGDICHDEPLPA